METRGSVLFLGDFDTTSLREATSAADDARLAVQVESRWNHARETFERARAKKQAPWSAIVLGDVRHVEGACAALRYEPELATVPILAMSRDVGDLEFEALFGAGGDDLVAPTRDGLAKRLRAVSLASGAPATKRGVAIVLDSDRRGRMLAGRALRNAGWDVAFAIEPAEAIEQARRANVELIVAAGTFEENGETFAARLRREGLQQPVVIAAPPRECASVRKKIAHLDRVAVFDSFGAPENVLFVANETARKTFADARASARVLYGTTVRFRAAGADHDELGYSYNVSAGGVYVRTLAPLPRGAEAWLEMRPPRSDRRVRLEGRVVWTRGFGPNDAATVPAGFGVQIVGGSTSDLERFRKGTAAFAAEIMGS